MTIVAIERIAAGGDGVGKLDDGRIVFVPRTAPGDEIEVEIDEVKPRFARGHMVRLVQGSPLRTDPECPHYLIDRCGGCQLQHMTLDGQVAAKQRIAGDAIRRIAGRPGEDPRGVPSPAAWRYRSKVTLAARGDVIGLHRHDDPGDIFPLVDCLITNEGLMQLWTRIREHRDELPRTLSSLILRRDRDGGMHVVAVAGADPWDASRLATRLGIEGISLWWHPEGGAARIVAGKRTGFPVLAFEQVNPALAGSIREDAVSALGDISGKVAWDLYGGVGDTARMLAARGARVWSVDADRGAIEWAKRSAGPIKFVANRVEDALVDLPVPDAIVANPPRAGLHERVAAYLEKWSRPAAKVAYVSCDPATLARDLKRMGSLRLSGVTAYDLFPQTAHVEVLAVLEGQ